MNRLSSRARRFQLLAAGAVLTGIACADRGAAPKAPSPPPAATATAVAPSNTRVAGSLPYYLDPAEECHLLEAKVFPDPAALIQRFVAADNAGVFLASTPLQDSVYACPGHLGGSDEFSVVRRSTVVPLHSSDSLAIYLVHSELLGEMRQDSVAFHFDAERREVEDTFRVVHTPHGWRILSPEAAGRVLAARLLASGDSLVRIQPAARDSLARAVARP